MVRFFFGFSYFRNLLHSPPMNASKTIVVLFNYGGGMRGLIPAHFMSRIEEVTGLRMVDMIDVFAGPSTGSILNAAMNIPHPDNPTRPRFQAKQMVRFYEREGIKIFPQDRFRDFRAMVHDFNNRTMKIGQLKKLFRHGHYDPAHLKMCLKALYGDNKLSDSLRSLIIPTYNLDGDQLTVIEEEGEDQDAPVHTKNNFMDQGGYAVWLKNMKLPNHHATPNVLLHDAVLASTAAPTFFPCHHFPVDYDDTGQTAQYTGIDGSIFDNPCISYHGAIRQHIPKDYKVIMIMLGTGHTHRSFKREDWNKLGGLGVVDPVNNLPLINILFHASETALLDSFAQEVGDDMYMFNKSMIAGEKTERSPNTQIDDASPENLKRLYHFFEDTLEENKTQFDEMCNVLVRNHEANKAAEKQERTGVINKITSLLSGRK